MAYVPDMAVRLFHLLSRAEIIVFTFYCEKRNKRTGGWEFTDEYVAAEINISRSRVFEARRKLEKNGWIREMYKCGTKRFICPIVGFFIENSTDFVENSTDFVENSTNPLKELPAQLPTQLTSEGATSSAPHTPPDKIFKNQPAGKPAPRSSANQPTNAAPAEKPADERRFHPAVQMVKDITGRYPPKDQRDRISREIGNEPKTEFFRRSFEKWRGFGGNPQNYEEWLFVPNKTGKPPQRFERNGNGNGSGKPIDVPKHDPKITLDEIGRNQELGILLEIKEMGGDISQWKNNYAPDDWAWLMENLKTEIDEEKIYDK